MPINDLECFYDGVCVYTTTKIKSTVVGKCFLALINLVFLGMIVVFCVAKVAIVALVFFGFELLVIRYTLWNLFGEERLIINTKTLSYQQYYGFFTSNLYTMKLNKGFEMLPYDEIIEHDKKHMKFFVRSYTDDNLPKIIYHSVLSVPENEFAKLMLHIDQLVLNDATGSFQMGLN